MHAVSPFSGPEQGLDTLDHEFFVKAADALLDGLAVADVGRLVAVDPGGEPARRGQAAGDGRPGRVPDGNPAVRAGAHGRPAPTAGARGRPRRPGDADARRALGARRCPDGAVPHRGERLPGDGPEPWLSYADLAVAVVDEIERPVRRRKRVSVFNFRSQEG
ncbi:hypothetical protein ACWCPX_06865 [Streptomyces olivaceoviridis]